MPSASLGTWSILEGQLGTAEPETSQDTLKQNHLYGYYR